MKLLVDRFLQLFYLNNRGYLVLAIALIFAFTYSVNADYQTSCTNIRIDFNAQNISQNQFLNENNVISLLAIDTGKAMIIGRNLKDINTHNLEKKLVAHPYIKYASISRTLSGDVAVSLLLEKPMARCFFSDGSQQYINQSGGLMPISDNFTARVRVVSGLNREYGLEKITKSKRYPQLFEFLNEIENDKFLDALIPHINFNNNQVEIIPQIGKQRIIFGGLDNYKIKLAKLRLFYKKILPSQGWNKYSEVDLNYKNQIICR